MYGCITSENGLVVALGVLDFVTLKVCLNLKKPTILHFPIQQMGFATSQSFWISSILLPGNMLPADTEMPWKSTSGMFLQSG